MKRKTIALCSVVVLAACGQGAPSDTADSLVSNPTRIRQIMEKCRLDRASVSDQVCTAAREAFRRRFFGERPDEKSRSDDANS
ncbi:MAG: EexN family lipoprotein [Janthinobacterium lividum]